MIGRIYFHRDPGGLFTREFSINIKNSAQLDLHFHRIEMGDIKVDLVLPVDPQPHFRADLEDRPGSDVTRHKVSVFGVPFLQKIPFFIIFVCPETAALASNGFGDEAQFISARDGRGVELDKFCIRVFCPLLEEYGVYRPHIDKTVRCLPINIARPAGAVDDRVRFIKMYPHGYHVYGNDSLCVVVLIGNKRKKLVALIFMYDARGLVLPDLLVQRVKKLLSRGRARVRRSVKPGAPEPSKV